MVVAAILDFSKVKTEGIIVPGTLLLLVRVPKMVQIMCSSNLLIDCGSAAVWRMLAIACEFLV